MHLIYFFSPFTRKWILYKETSHTFVIPYTAQSYREAHLHALHNFPRHYDVQIRQIF